MDIDLQRPAAPDLRLLIRVMTPVIIAALVGGGIFQYRRATVQVEQRFNERQAYLAHQAADRLSEVFAEVKKFLLLAGHVLARGQSDSGASLLSRMVGELKDHGAIAAWRRTATGEKITVGADAAQLQRLAARHSRCATGRVCLEGPISSVLTTSGRVLIATLSFGAEAGSPPPPQRAALGVVLDWGQLQALIGRITKLSPDSYAWVLDADGRLIMHPEHREQLGRDALQPGSSCASCHISFDLHREMARGGSGTGRIQVRDGQPKLVAYTRVRASGQSWSLAVATPAAEVTAHERGNLLSILLFTGAIMLVMVTGAVLLDRESSRRVRTTAAFNRQLAAKVAERTEEIQALYDRLATLQAHHTRLERVAVAGEMAAIVAHEIRTPLNALSINAQMISRKLRRGLREEDRDKVLEALGTLEKEIERINRMLEDHLLAMVRHRPYHAQTVNLNDAVSDVLSFMEPEATRARVELLPSLALALPPVAADVAKLRQVLLNIVLNAIQAMPDGGKVTISTAVNDSCGVATITDTGPGIAAKSDDDIEQVFKPFVTTKEDGTGLGLAICARLIKEMGGRIRVHSKPGEGATFMVMVPVASSEEVQACL